MSISLEDVRRDWAKYRRRLIALLNPKANGPRYFSPIGFSTGITTSAPPARSGNVVTACKVKLTKLVPSKPQTNPPSYTITDQGLPDVNAIQLSGLAGAAGHEVVMVRIFGVRIIVAYDCTATAAPMPAQDAMTTTQTNQTITTQSGDPITTQ